MKIPSADPGAVYRDAPDEFDSAINSVLESGAYIHGEQCSAFEAEFAAWCGVPETAGVASGTAALQLALMAVGVRKGDLVATVSHTAVATAAAIDNAGARCLLVDIDPSTFTMSPDGLKQALDEHDGRVKAIVPVHLYGHPADMPRICELGQGRNVPVIEDCAQAHGASFEGQLVGTWGRAGAFSFYPTKNLPCFGDGGAVGGDPEIVEYVSRAREYGWMERQVSAFPGTNARLDEIQAAILRVSLRRLPGWNERRRAVATRYMAHLGDVVDTPHIADGASHVFHQFVIKVEGRDALRRYLFDRGIGSAVHYPLPVHLQPAYEDRVLTSSQGLENTEHVMGKILSFPVHPQLSDDEVDAVCEAVIAWYNSRP